MCLSEIERGSCRVKVAERERKSVCVCVSMCGVRVCVCTKRVSRRHSRTLRIKGRDVNTVCSEFKRVSKGPRSVTLSRVDEKWGGGVDVRPFAFEGHALLALSQPLRLSI